MGSVSFINLNKVWNCVRMAEVPCLHAETLAWKERNDTYSLDIIVRDSLVASGVFTDMVSLSGGEVSSLSFALFALPHPGVFSGEIGAASRLRPERRCLGGIVMDRNKSNYIGLRFDAKVKSKVY